MKTPIESSQAPKPIGPYSQAVKKDNTLYISGQLPLNVDEDFLVNSDFSLATKQVMDNIDAILSEAGMDFSHITFCSIFITNMSKFSEVNTVYAQYFSEPFPARQVIEVSALPLNAIIEISAIAHV
ncbi:MAG: Rid family detoxifying hydrolase [Bacteroidota bacterium]